MRGFRKPLTAQGEFKIDAGVILRYALLLRNETEMGAQLDPNMRNTHVNHYTVEPQPHAGGLFGSKQAVQADPK